tara:strand:+ start:202 stop:498 length:297 start_codon:yes stop_codon:yes gene_type:complete
MSKIIEYSIVYSDDYIDFIGIVNDMINRGYQPYGNTFMANDTINNHSCYHQPMVKYESMIKHEPRWKSWKRENEFKKRGLCDEIIILDDISLKRTKSF